MEMVPSEAGGDILERHRTKVDPKQIDSPLVAFSIPPP
jgi:hypothetical protein